MIHDFLSQDHARLDQAVSVLETAQKEAGATPLLVTARLVFLFIKKGPLSTGVQRRGDHAVDEQDDETRERGDDRTR